MAFPKRSAIVNLLTISSFAVAGWTQPAVASSALDQFRHVGVSVH